MTHSDAIEIAGFIIVFVNGTVFGRFLAIRSLRGRR